MKTISRFTLDHHTYEGSRLHNDLNRLVQQVNDNLTEHQVALDAANKTITAQAAQIAALIARVTDLESAN